jgi:hypothetical protein
VSRQLIEGTRDTAKRSTYWSLKFDLRHFGFSFVVYLDKLGQAIKVHLLWLDFYSSSVSRPKGKP